MPFLLNTGRPADAGSLTPSLQPLQPTLPTTVRQNPWARLCVAALGISVLAACSGKDSSTQPGANKAANEPTVGVVVLATENQTLSTELPGRTTAFQNADIRPQINGIIQKRQFTEGSLVKANQPLYQVDPATYEAAQASAQAVLAKAQATARTAQVNAKRNAALVEIDAISRQVFDESQALVQQTQADVAVAQAALEAARINMRYTRILAPISGRIGLSAVTAGALVTANQATALATIQQLDPIYVDITQSSADLLQLRKQWQEGKFTRVDARQAKVRLVLEDGSTYPLEGTLQFTGTAVNPTSGAITLRATFPNPDHFLMPGMYVRAQLATSVAPQALLIPQEAVIRNPAGAPSVQVVEEGNKLVKRPVELGQAVGNRWLVISGVKAGDKVMVDGFQKARLGQTVKPTVVPPREQAAPAATPPASAASAASSARL
ncbi:efflux RND transporter periplasmic adaptor subunit [Acidovorax radicis]|jgi:membrane fusion protein (multidrug efflux system)|uniref:efflux RND transporter periplasmic adaptor subunit n=1 Tax=Acidovorax radicis TaxID=758826 RepID=UPI001CFBEEDA|nr:efflux RND transporter periplasmic adaptor subunit [Acidovorax radicis]UCU99898.1 efflux RND transporter periplasmic adaptor subunit [Acidovorax radicis]